MSSSPPIPPPHWPRVWRGESGGELFEVFDNAKTRHGVGFFFAQMKEQAQLYAAPGTQPRSFALDPGDVLDLRDPCRPGLPARAAQVLAAVRAEFDEWVDRYSGEPMDLTDFLEAGTLYDYEGTGSGSRWNCLFQEAASAGFDSVVVRDQTDGVSGDDAVVWVVFDPARIHALADPGEVLATTPAPVPRRRGW